MEISKKVAQGLLDREAVRISFDPPFTWTSGIKSPIYCDNRKMIAYPEEREVIVDGFVEMIREKGWEPDVIAGTATAGIPWAAFVAQKMRKPMIYVRSKPKAHGAKKQIEGALETGKKVLIVEDLISTGGSSIKSAQAVRDEGGCEVIAVAAIVTYEMVTAAENFMEAGIEAVTLTNFSTLIAEAVEKGAVTAEQADKVRQFAEDPQVWWGKVGG